jgi:hypothetical protein
MSTFVFYAAGAVLLVVTVFLSKRLGRVIRFLPLMALALVSASLFGPVNIDSRVMAFLIGAATAEAAVITAVLVLMSMAGKKETRKP